MRTGGYYGVMIEKENAGKKERDYLEVSVRLKGEIINRYTAIKKIKGIESDAELIRLLISDEYRRLGFV